MASTPTPPPPPQCSTIPTAKPSQNHKYTENTNTNTSSNTNTNTSRNTNTNINNNHRHRHHHQHHRQQQHHQHDSRNHRHSNPYLAANKPCIPTFNSLPSSKSQLSPDFSGRRSTRSVSKMHSGRPRASSGRSPHTAVADGTLHQLLQCGNDAAVIEHVLLSNSHRLCGADDYIHMIRDLGNRGEGWKVKGCFDFAMRGEKKRYDQGRLTSIAISSLGRCGHVEDACRIFEVARNAGYGNNVYSFSALVSAYGRNGRFKEAISVFEHMKKLSLKPNLVTYNAVIDACAKGGVDFKRAGMYFDEMLTNGIQPDRITYNSLISVCSGTGLWEMALDLFSQMMERGVDQDLFTFNTLLDALCKSEQMDLAIEVMAEMPSRKILPNVVTYSTMIDGYAKVGRLEEALNLFNEMKFLSFELDRVSYNTLIAIYASLGRFEEALDVCKEMESCGIDKDTVTYNAFLGGYGKHGKYDEVRKVYEEMKADNVIPNLLTYTTLMDVYCKGGLYREAMDAFRQFKKAGMKADVVVYSALIDSLCKKGLVESAVMLLDEMTKDGVMPNVVTYNSIIDAFGGSAGLECGVETSFQDCEHRIGPSSSMLVASPFQNQVDDKEDNQIIQMFGQLAADKAGHWKNDKRGRQDMNSILWLFQKMHKLEIKPNVVTFSAILSACSRCNSFEDASLLLEELRLFDNQVYGVAHGLLMGFRENIWFQAQSLFDEIKHMDSATATAFYNALTDVLWHWGQKRGAQLVVLEGKRRNVWDSVWSDSCLDLHMMSRGAACAMVHTWLLNIRSVVFEGCQLPRLLSILTGWGKHSKVVGDGTLRKAVEALLNGMGAPFRVAECNIGRFMSPGYVVAAWLKEWSTLNLLVLHDRIKHPESAESSQVYNLQALRL